MVLQVLADGQVDDRRDAVLAQVIGGPMPDSISRCGELKHPPERITSRSARTIVRSLPRRYSMSDRALTFHDDAGRERVDLERDVGALQGRAQEGDGGGAAPSGADGGLAAREPSWCLPL